jgi:ubiquinone/menaquinone biosynthesis C-methylase UbiE
MMGLIFDSHSAKRYESWYLSAKGEAFHGFIERHIPSLLNPHAGDKVLDIGCGSGKHLQYLSTLGIDITGVDASPYMINQARERLGDRCSLKTGMAEDLPFEDNEFDIAIFINTLEFLDDPLPALMEAGRVTRRRVFIGIINSLSWYRFYDKILRLFHHSPLQNMKSYNLWELKTYIMTAFGQVPITWKSMQVFPHFFTRMGGFSSNLSQQTHCPFGPFLGLSLKIAYTIKTDNLPLKLRVNKAGRTVASGITPIGTVNQNPSSSQAKS